MAINRIRARLRFTNASGMAAWCQSNMGVRYGQAVHINEGLANEEQKKNEVIADGANHSVYECDLPLMNQAHAIDAYNTLNAIKSQSVLFEDESVGFIERHTCYHDEETPQPCTIDERVEITESNQEQIEEWIQPTGAHDAYNIGDKVSYNGKNYESTVNANVYAPGVVAGQWIEI